MIRERKFSYQGMSKDLAKDKDSNKYYDAKNIRIMATDQESTYAITNEAGNKLVVSIPTPVFNYEETRIEYDSGAQIVYLKYSAVNSSHPRCELESNYVNISGQNLSNKTSGPQKIIGVKELRDSALIVTTDDNGWDCVWELNGLNDDIFYITLLYMNDLGFSTDNLVNVLFNYENSIIQKVYLADGVHQIRYMNIRQSVDNGDLKNLIDTPSTSLDMVGTFNLSQINIDGIIGGGSHTSGMIQYAYNLYVLNGAQTVVSPLSSLEAISKDADLGGGEVNEVLGRSVSISIDEIDKDFTHIKIYSIKYTAYNEVPDISIIADQEIDSSRSISFTDTGALGDSISLESFLFLGASPVIPSTISTKDNTLFAMNIKEDVFEVDLDTRAYSFSGIANQSRPKVMDNAYYNANFGSVFSQQIQVPLDFSVPEKHDSVNPDHEIYKYQSDKSTLGATGKYIEVELLQTSMTDTDSEKFQFFKDNEFYRIGIKFFNRRGQSTNASWIMDLKAPEGNLKGEYNQLKVSFTSEFYSWITNESNFESEDDKPIGYRIVRAERGLQDKTIAAQGMINPMVASYWDNAKLGQSDFNNIASKLDSFSSRKMPSITRMFNPSNGVPHLIPFNGCKSYSDLSDNYSAQSTSTDRKFFESYRASGSNEFRAQTFQFNKLMQMFSPEISLLEDINIDSSYKLRVKGLAKNDQVNSWVAENNPITGLNSAEAVFNGGVNPSSFGGLSGLNNLNSDLIIGDTFSWIHDMAFFGPTNGSDTSSVNHIHQSFKGGFFEANGRRDYNIFGTPEITEAGAGYRLYNNEDSFRYSNNLKSMLLDEHVEGPDNAAVQIKGCNSNGSRCITFAEGLDDSNLSISSRKDIETIHINANTGETEGVLIAEFVKPSHIYYIGGIYGGNTYEAKSNSVYIDIGNYEEIKTNGLINQTVIESPGDTFVSDFTFAKMSVDSEHISTTDYNVITEIVSLKVETSVDLKNRNDLSKGEWNSVWKPSYEDYNKYNKVYSQKPTLVKSVSESYKLKKIKDFDTRIIATGVKTPGEFIDSWTDFLENEDMDLDGKYGPLNTVINYNDNIYAIQDNAVALIQINPRVQVSASDGIGVELGTGSLLYQYKYLTTTSGCLNRNGVIPTPSGFYFVDIFNSSILYCNGQSVLNISDKEGFHSELLNKMNYNELKQDNPVSQYGVSLGYNSNTGDVLFSFTQSSDSFTLCYNEKVGAFVSYYDYIPAWYINKGTAMLSTNSDSNELWQHFKGDSNSFYGETFKSSITLHLVAQNKELVMNGASYRLEMHDSEGNVLANEGLTSVKVWNKYQESEDADLVIRKNAFRRIRDWNIKFPRVSGSRERVRGSWGYAEFTFNNDDGKKLILHDITIFYTE